MQTCTVSYARLYYLYYQHFVKSWKKVKALAEMQNHLFLTIVMLQLTRNKHHVVTLLKKIEPFYWSTFRKVSHPTFHQTYLFESYCVFEKGMLHNNFQKSESFIWPVSITMAISCQCYS